MKALIIFLFGLSLLPSLMIINVAAQQVREAQLVQAYRIESMLIAGGAK